MLRDILRSFVFVTLPTIVVLFLLAELVFRLLIPAAELPVQDWDASMGVVHYEPRTSGLYTKGPFAQIRGRWSINDYGWNSEIDYVRKADRTKPLIAVIGDSFVEGLHVDVGEHMASVIRRRAGDRYDAYSFGMSGSPLSEYLVVARYVERTFDPDVMVVLIVHNDFDESLCSVVPDAHHARLEVADEHIVEKPIEWKAAKPASRLFLKSALVRYALYNLGAYNRLVDFRQRRNVERSLRENTSQPTYEANIDVERMEANLDDIKRAVGYVTGRFSAEFKTDSVMFVMDAVRDLLYRDALDSSRAIVLNRVLKNATDTSRVAFVDLTEAFASRFARTGERFDPPLDAHWNALGQMVAAETILDSLRSFGFIRSPVGSQTKRGVPGYPDTPRSTARCDRLRRRLRIPSRCPE